MLMRSAPASLGCFGAIVFAASSTLSVACETEPAAKSCSDESSYLEVDLDATNPLLERGCLKPVVPLCSPNFGYVEGGYVDVDPNVAGTQYWCRASDIQNAQQPNQTEQHLPECDANATNRPCWRVVPDPQLCPTGDEAALEIIRTVAPPPNNRTGALCQATCLYCSP